MKKKILQKKKYKNVGFQFFVKNFADLISFFRLFPNYSFYHTFSLTLFANFFTLSNSQSVEDTFCESSLHIYCINCLER